MSKQVSPIERVIKEKESKEVGGIVSQIFGEQGCRKTLSLVNKALIDFHNDRIVYWRGQPSCQWILLASNHIPVTLWMHEDFDSYQFNLTGSKKKGIGSIMDIDLEQKSDIDVEIKRFEEIEELVEDCSLKRANVYFFPEKENPVSSKGEKNKYYYQKRHVQFFSALNNRNDMDHVSILNDENDNVFGDDTKGSLHNIQEYELPGEVEDFRKNRISHMGATHSYQSVHYKYHNVKVNDRVYMRRAKVHGQDSDVSQEVVNRLDRGEFVVPGFQKDNFKMPYLPHETISWIKDEQEVKLRMDYTATIPDLRPEKYDEEQVLDDLPVDAEDLNNVITPSEYAELAGWTTRNVQKKLAANKLPGIKLNGKWLMSMDQVVDNEELPS